MNLLTLVAARGDVSIGRMSINHVEVPTFLRALARVYRQSADGLPNPGTRARATAYLDALLECSSEFAELWQRHERAVATP